MAQLVSNQVGNLNNSAVFDTVANTYSIHATTNINLSTSNQFTAAFTAPNTVNAVTSLSVFVNAKGSAGTVTFTLQQSTIDVASVTASVSSLPTRGWFNVQLGAPFTYTTTAAGAYRWKITIAGATGTTSLAADAAGTAFAYMSSDNRNAAPGTSDDIALFHEVTVNTTGLSFGTGSNTTATTTGRLAGSACIIGKNGHLKFSRVANNDVTVKGDIYIFEGIFDKGTVADPINAVTSILYFDQNGTTGNHGFYFASNAQCYMQGATKTLITRYVSGNGTTATPLVLQDAVGWSVNDRIVIAPASNSATNYNEDEAKYIRTAPTASTYTLSDTAGGAESGLIYTHQTLCHVINITSNNIITTTNSAHNWYAVCQITTGASCDIDYMHFDNFGTIIAGKQGWYFFGGGATMDGNIDNLIMTNGDGCGITFQATNTARTYSNLVAWDFNQTTGGGGPITLFNGTKNKLFQNCVLIQCARGGISYAGASNNLFQECWLYGVNSSGASAIGAIVGANSPLNKFESGGVNCSRYPYILTTVTDNVFVSFDFGVLFGENKTSVAHILPSAETYNTLLLQSCTFSSNLELYTGEELMVSGSALKFFRIDDDPDYHIVAFVGGEMGSAGPGLPDTTTKEAGSKAIYFAPNGSGEPLDFVFLLPTRPDFGVFANGFGRVNSSFTSGSFEWQLYLPDEVIGINTPSDTYTFDISNTNQWDVMDVSANYLGVTEEASQMRVLINSTAAGARAYIDSFYNATRQRNPVAACDVWVNGLPANILIPEAGDPQGVWAVLQAIVNVDGTMGQKLLRSLEEGDFIALKD